MASIQDSFINLRNDLKIWITNNLRLKANKSDITASDGNVFTFDIDDNGYYGYYTVNNEFIPFDREKVLEEIELLRNRTFEFTGQIDIFTAPTPGVYKLEVWGGQGGMSGKGSKAGGKGGYSSGYVTLERGESIYVVVGGAGQQGKASATASGGYNGGGNGIYGTSGAGGGGGATHIAKASGVLKDLVNNKSSVLIVAGGGGGSNYYSSSSYSTGGTGGGLTGGKASNAASNECVPGSQTAAGEDAGFGYGGSGTGGGKANQSTAGGGGGYYGGGRGNDHLGGGGGSGFIGNVLQGETSNGKNEGNGKAVITYAGQNIDSVSIS